MASFVGPEQGHKILNLDTHTDVTYAHTCCPSNAVETGYTISEGGYGPPQDLDMAFYDHHTSAGFQCRYNVDMAAYSQTRKQDDTAIESAVFDCALPDDDGAAQAVAIKEVNDSGIVMEELNTPDTEILDGNGASKDSQNMQNISRNTLKTLKDTPDTSNNTRDSSKGHHSFILSQSLDSTYGTQTVQRDQNPSGLELAEADEQLPPISPRKKLTPKKPTPIRRSTRISKLRKALDSQPTQSVPTCSSLKRGREPGTKSQGRKQKRMKACQA
jgi:hypothetical protein